MELHEEEEPEMKLMTDKKGTCVYVCALVRQIVLNLYSTTYSPLYI